MSTGTRKDPYLGFNFLVEIEGLVAGGFSLVTGLQSEIETMDYREGGVNGFVHRLPGAVRYPANIMLRHGVSDDHSLWLWHRDVSRGEIVRRNLSIIMLNQAHQSVKYWNIERAYPVRWVGPDFRSNQNSVAIETLELAHCGIRQE